MKMNAPGLACQRRSMPLLTELKGGFGVGLTITMSLLAELDPSALSRAY
jgi:hypothetical protein